MPDSADQFFAFSCGFVALSSLLLARHGAVVCDSRANLHDPTSLACIANHVAEAQLLCLRWRADYNHRRLQRALGKQTPAEYAAKCEVSAARRLVQRMETTGNTRKAASIMIA